MVNETPGTYCQNCFTWNPGERETCRKCGTRLLILSGDQAWDESEESEAQEDLDEHLLERITGLEESLRRIETYLEAVSDQLGRLERSEVMLRNGLMSLVQELESKGQLDGHAFSERWEALVDENLQLIGARELFTRYRARILPIAKPRSMSQLRRALLETSALLEEAQVPEAAQRLAEALPLDPKNYELIFTVAALKNAAGQPEEAEALARKVTQLSPRHYEAWMLLAKLLREDANAPQAAIQALRQAAQLRPDEAEPRLQLCELLLDEEDPQGALEAIQEALALQRDGESLTLAGETFLALGEASKAIAALKEASGFLPGDLAVREMLAEGYLLAGERPKAVAILADLLRQHPNDHELLLLLDAESPEQLHSARGGRPQVRWILDEAETALREGRIDEAEAHLRKLRRKDRTDRSDWVELQIAFRRDPQKTLPEALAFAESKRHPRLCFLALRMALDHLLEGPDPQAVETALETYLQAHPKSSGAWEAALIRMAHRLMRGPVTDEDLAEVRRLQATPLPGQESRARSLLGQYLLELNRPGDVVELLAPVIKSEPLLIHHFQLGTALAALGAREEAENVLEAGLDASPGELPEPQAELVRSKMRGLLQELRRPSPGTPKS